MSLRQLCDVCGLQAPRFESVAVLGPVDIARWHLCAECSAREDSVALAGTPPNADAAVLALGPIRFDDLRVSLAALSDREPPEVLTWCAETIRAIAQHHGQSLPVDVRAFVERHGPP